jgi:hypothetical protein
LIRAERSALRCGDLNLLRLAVNATDGGKGSHCFPLGCQYRRLSNAIGGTIADSEGQGTIINDDAPPLPTLAITDVTQAEGNKKDTRFVFTVSLSSSSSSTVTVLFATADGTATSVGNGNQRDFSTSLGALAFSPGETIKTVTVLVTGEKKVEPTETFFVNLSSASSATIAGQGVGTIVNDDGAAVAIALDFHA